MLKMKLKKNWNSRKEIYKDKENAIEKTDENALINNIHFNLVSSP